MSDQAFYYSISAATLKSLIAKSLDSSVFMNILTPLVVQKEAFHLRGPCALAGLLESHLGDDSWVAVAGVSFRPESTNGPFQLSTHRYLKLDVLPAIADSLSLMTLDEILQAIDWERDARGHWTLDKKRAGVKPKHDRIQCLATYYRQTAAQQLDVLVRLEFT